MMLRMIAVAVIAAVAAGCGMDSAGLGEYVKREMQVEMVKKTGLKSLKMKEVVLVKEQGIDYVGVGVGEIDGESIKFNVKCKYDGSSVLWSAEPQDDSMAMLATKETAKEICQKLKAVWPEVKKGVSDCYDAAKKTTTGAIDAVRDKLQ